jgi:hypothetical protein
MMFIPSFTKNSLISLKVLRWDKHMDERTHPHDDAINRKLGRREQTKKEAMQIYIS